MHCSSASRTCRAIWHGGRMSPVMPVAASLRFTYSDYLLLPEDRRYEVIDGDLFMTPSPTTYHQRISRNLEFLLHRHVREKGIGEVLYAPCDVVLSETDVVQPDLLFVSRERAGIIGEKCVSGAPDLVVEVLSEATAERDRTVKAKLYARAGVRELWIVDPSERSIALLANTPEGFLRKAFFSSSETLRSPLLPGLEIPLVEIF